MSSAIRKRSGSGSKTRLALKEKIVQMYEQLFRHEHSSDNEVAATNPDQFWSEFFLLKPKVAALESELLKLPPDQLVQCREQINALFINSLDNLGAEHHIKVVYALQTLCGLFRAVYKKSSNMQHCGFDLINLLMGFDTAEENMQTLSTHLNNFLTGDEPASLKDLCLKLLLIIVTGIDNVSQNTLLEYLMLNSVFESVVHLLSNSESRSLHGQSSVLLLTILVQYRKYESANPYVVKLSILDQELALLGYGQVITSSLCSFVSGYEASLSDQPSTGWLSSFTSMVGNMFVSDEGSGRVEQMKARNAVLLALYEAIHLNRNFIATLAHYQTEASSPLPTPSSSHSNLTINSEDVPAGSNGLNTANTNTTAPEQDQISTPSNLLVTFLEYCSIIMQDTKTESSQNTTKLNFLILLCVTEDQYANALMHDPNLVFRVKLHRAPMRHRKPSFDLQTHSRSLACAVLDLVVEFVRSHMMKRFPLELYLHALAIAHRLLAYQKRARVRLSYPWKELWTSLISLIKFITGNESSLVKKMNIFAVGLQVTTIFNLFVTYGDTFLPSPSSYDELYYEMVRCHGTFDSLYSMGLRYSTAGGEYKDAAVKLTNSLVNIRAITAHFNPKIENWLSSQQLSTPTEEQILEVVKSNYDSLTLRLQDGLDQYEHYTESPRHSPFFTTMVRSVVADTRGQIVLNDLELQMVLQDFSTIQ